MALAPLFYALAEPQMKSKALFLRIYMLMAIMKKCCTCRAKHDGTPDTVHMEGNAVFKMAVNTLDQIVDETLTANNMQKSDIDWLVPHQANIRILQATAKKLDMPMDKVVVTVDKHGNTSAASIPLALDVAVRDGRIKRGDVILMEAFGGGFTWGSALIKY